MKLKDRVVAAEPMASATTAAEVQMGLLADNLNAYRTSAATDSREIAATPAILLKYGNADFSSVRYSANATSETCNRLLAGEPSGWAEVGSFLPVNSYPHIEHK